MSAPKVKIVTTCGDVKEEFNLADLGVETTTSEERLLFAHKRKESASSTNSDTDKNEMEKIEVDKSHLTLKESIQLTQRRSAIMPDSGSEKIGKGRPDAQCKPRLSKTGINTEELKGAPDEVYGLTKNQIEAFNEVFTLFDINGGGTIDASELDQALRSVDICLTIAELKDVLCVIDEDGNGEIDFDEFLNLMTSTEKFLATIGDKRRNSYQSILFNALTRFMRKSALSSLSEIER